MSLDKTFTVGSASSSSSASSTTVPVGAMMIWPMDTIPTEWASNWMIVQDQVYSRSAYPELFKVYGTRYNIGGETSDQFRLAPTHGRAPVGVGTYTDSVSGSVSRTLGTKLGAEKHTLVTAELASHSHRMGKGAAGANANYVTTSAFWTSLGNGVNDIFFTGPVEATGSGTAHNNMQPSLVVNFIVRFK